MDMKYERPMVVVEHFEMSQTIAACTTRISFQDSKCVLSDPDAPQAAKELAYINWFLNNDVCDDHFIGPGGSDGICYHTQANAMFSS